MNSNMYNMMQVASVLVLSFRSQLVRRFRKTNLLAAADLNVVIGVYFIFLLCFHAFLRYEDVRRQQQLTTLLILRIFVLLCSGAGYPSAIDYVSFRSVAGCPSFCCLLWLFCFTPLRTCGRQGGGSFWRSRNCPGKQRVPNRPGPFPGAGVC